MASQRTTRSTTMNTAKDGEHAGSSRSHCALILTLYQLDRAADKLSKTTMHVIDLAVAERPSSNGGAATSCMEVIMQYWRGEPVRIVSYNWRSCFLYCFMK